MKDWGHKFLFASGSWVGEGKISFTASKDQLKFYTRWMVRCEREEKNFPEKVTCTQDVEMQGAEEHIQNRFVFSQFTDSKFVLELENELIGSVQGTGLFEEKKIAWEFRGHPSFEGFEVYELQENGDYLFHAEYVSPDQFRSIIDGRIWEKELPTSF